MYDMEVDVSPFEYVPTEVMFNIFSYLPAKDFMRSRKVCRRWKFIIDGLAQNDGLWAMYCKNDFANLYWDAKKKAGLSWYNLYKSLNQWSNLSDSDEDVETFAVAPTVNDEVRNVALLGDGVVAVHKKNEIQYYDVDTLDLLPRSFLRGDYLKYKENSKFIVIQSYNYQLFIIRKGTQNINKEPNVTIDDVTMFLLTDDELYFVKSNNNVHFTNFGDGEKITYRFLKSIEDDDGIMALGFSEGCLNVLTYQRNIYTISKKNELKYRNSLPDEPYLMNLLNNYNFLSQLDWRVYYIWMYILNHSVPNGPMKCIMTLQSYGDIFFVGTSYGYLCIFHRPYINGKIDLFNSQPIRQIKFTEDNDDKPPDETSPILNVDVLEIENGHMVFVAMPQRIAILKYTHCLLAPAPWTIMETN